MKKILSVLAGIAVAVDAMPAQVDTSAPSEGWQKEPVEFVRLLVGEDLSLRPSPRGVPEVAVPDAVRQKVIGTRVNWTVFRRKNPLGSGPSTLAAVGITHGNQSAGVLLVTPRRVAGDTEICDAPYRDSPINASIQIEGRITSFRVGIRPDGNRVVVVELTEVAGCAATASTTADLGGSWSHERRGGRTTGVVKGTLELTRDASCDQEGFTCFRGANQYEEKKEVPKTTGWLVGIRGSQVSIIMGSAVTTCGGAIEGADKIVAECGFMGQTSIGTLTLTRVRSPSPQR